MIYKSALDRAKAEAKRFLERARKCEYSRNKDYLAEGQKTAALKRASLDLSQALADMRQERE